MNLLENWKKECDLLSTDLIIVNNKPRVKLARKDVESIYQILANYFPQEFLSIEKGKKPSLYKSNWLHDLLGSYNRAGCIIALFEIANILLYMKKLNESIQLKVKSSLNDPLQLRSLFFELYLFRLMDYNKIPNKKKPIVNNQELDATCKLNDIEFLCECKKIYAPDMDVLDTLENCLTDLTEKLQALKRGFGLIGTLKLNKPGDKKLKNIIKAKISLFIKKFHEQKYLHTVDYHHEDEHGLFSVVNYNTANRIEVESKKNYQILFKVIPPFNPTPGIPNHYPVYVELNFSMTENQIMKHLFSKLKKGRKQHSHSPYEYKIYFIDNEIIPELKMPIFRTQSMFNETKINSYVNKLSENEILCFVIRDYMDDFPKITIKAFGKNIDPLVKSKLENLKTNFDSHVEIDNKNPRKPFNSIPTFPKIFSNINHSK